MPFYSQAAVDGHYRRMSSHNETAKDKEFEDGSELLQWYLQRAKQVLRERNEKDGGKAEPNSGYPGQGDQARQRRSIASANQQSVQRRPGTVTKRILHVRIPIIFRHGPTPRLVSNLNQAETNDLFRKYRKSTGFVFNGAAIVPNGY